MNFLYLIKARATKEHQRQTLRDNRNVSKGKTEEASVFRTGM